MARLRDRVIRRLLPQPVAVRHAEYSLLFSSDDDPAQPSERLFDLALKAADIARTLKLDALQARAAGAGTLVNVWPGEHYRLLAALVKALQPRTVIEIGTATGDCAITMKQALPPEGTVVTFDLVPWQQAGHGVMREEDFADGRLIQHLDDVTLPAGLAKHRALFESAELIFVDAAKDGAMEERLLRLWQGVAFQRKPVFVFDDIRLWNMLKVWRQMAWPKLDLTSFGHWTGTGLAEWQPGPVFR